jgi:protocatechuate 3,4-dioxygenase beta subunit
MMTMRREATTVPEFLGIQSIQSVPIALEFRRSPLRATLAVALAALLPATPAPGLDPHRPARVKVAVIDEEGRPLAEARVRLSLPERERLGWPEPPSSRETREPPSLELITDVSGTVKVERRRPDDARQIVWSETLQVGLDGFLPRPSQDAYPPDQDSYISLFPGARQELTMQMEREHTTLIRLRGPEGTPLPQVHFYVRSAKAGPQPAQRLLTNERGEALWRHRRLEEGFYLSSLYGESKSETFQDGPVVTVALDEQTLPSKKRLLRGELLQADGSAAVGWLVARKVRSGYGFGLIHGPQYWEVLLDNLIRVGADGRFEVELEVQAELPAEAEADARGVLAVISPRQVPFFYPLNPGSWSDGERHVTLRLPDVRRVHHGAVVDREGKPVAGLPIEADFVEWRGRRWTVRVGGDPDQPQWPRDTIWRANDGSVIDPVRTDAEGRYSIPIYFGSATRFKTSRHGWRWKGWDPDLATSAHNVWVRDAYDEPMHIDLFQQYKVATLVFEDVQGRHISNIHVREAETYADGKVMSRGGVASGSDSHGLHLFLKRSIDRVELTTNDPQREWGPLKTIIDVAGLDDQVVHVTLDEALRWLPLSGKVLDPDGRPVSKARVVLRHPASNRSAAWGGDVLRLNTIADEQGRFVFHAAPDDCRIDIRLRDGETGDALPGVMTPMLVGRETREVTIHLEHGGSVKVLLPQGIGDAADALFLKRADAPRRLPPRPGRYCSLTHIADRNELRSKIIPPGEYVLSHREYHTPLIEPFAALGDVRADVKAGDATVIDLREALKPVEHARSWTTVIVQHGGQPVSGAEVTVYVAAARPDDLARWIGQWRNGDAAVKQAAITNLRDAGALAVDAIRAAGDEDLDRDALLDELGGTYDEDVGNLDTDGLHRAAQDLTDDTGAVRCELEDGRNCVAVARVRGRLIGWQPFLAQGESVTVGLRPARTLVVRPRVTGAKDDKRSMNIVLQGPWDIGVRALMSTLFDGDTWFTRVGSLPTEAVFYHLYPMEPEGQTAWMIEDLPVWAACTVTLHESSFEDGRKPRTTAPITIAPGDGVQEVEW